MKVQLEVVDADYGAIGDVFDEDVEVFVTRVATFIWGMENDEQQLALDYINRRRKMESEDISSG